MDTRVIEQKNVGVVDVEYIVHYSHPTLGGQDLQQVKNICIVQMLVTRTYETILPSSLERVISRL